MGSGGTLYKGKVLAPFISMVIHGLLIAWSLILFFLSKKVFVNRLENVLKREFNFVMILVWMYTKYLSRFSFESRLEKYNSTMILVRMYAKWWFSKRCFERCEVWRMFLGYDPVIESYTFLRSLWAFPILMRVKLSLLLRSK